MTAAAIAGVFSDYKLVRTRSVVQIIVEVPVERQADVFAALGYPMPGQEIHVAVARMNSPAGSLKPDMKGAVSRPDKVGPQPPSPTPPAGELQRQRYASMSAGEQAVTRAAMLCQDVRFRAWVPAKWGCADQFKVVDADMAAEFIREHCCDGKSRKLIADVPEYRDRFLAMETDYMQDAGLMARPR